MKKRGFTLIELLAVIVVLAIIALIATPIVMNLIKKAQEGSLERSADNYVKVVETLITTNKLDRKPVSDGAYTIDGNGNLIFGEVELSGTKPVGGTVTVEKGQVIKDETIIKYPDYTVTFDNGIPNAEGRGEPSVLCTAIDPVAQPLNGSNVVVGIKATQESPYAIGAVYKCDLGDGERIFYVLKEEGANVKLIMEENISNSVLWCYMEYGNECGGSVALRHLNSRISGWTKLRGEGGTVELPAAQDIADAMNNTEWTADLTNKDFLIAQEQAWLRINLESTDTIDDFPSGYWTATPGPTDPTPHASTWVVSASSGLDAGDAIWDGGYGVRPVITISKENMSL